MNIQKIIDSNNINVLHKNILMNGYYININNSPTIIINNKLFGMEEDIVIAEEVAHFCVGATPTLPFADDYYNKLIRSKNEFKAFKWMQGNLLPVGIENLNYDTIWDLSDRFELPVEFIKKVIEYRKENSYGCKDQLR